MTGDPTPPPEVLAHYGSFDESRRLESGAGRLERIRTLDILRRHLPAPPADVIDIGGGTGAYACRLAQQGYRVDLIDPVPRHIDRANEASAAQPGHPLASARVGDARRLDCPDGAKDAALLLGPLYHLTDRPDRIAALREARRVLRPGGCVVIAMISRFASLLDGLRAGFLFDPRFASIVDRDLEEGQHRNTTEDPRLFTTAYFHRPEEIAVECAEAGLHHDGTLAVEGPLWLLPDIEAMLDDPARRAAILDRLARVEREPSLLGASAHLIGLARCEDSPTGPGSR